jgi:predicted nuclease with TOPRIM domain
MAWLVPLVPIGVASLALFGVIFTAIRRKDPTMSEVWAENSSLRDRLDRQDEKLDALHKEIDSVRGTFRVYREKAEEAVNILGAGFDVLFRMFAVKDATELNDVDRRAVEAARALRSQHPLEF